MARQHPGDSAMRIALAREAYLSHQHTVPALVLKGVGVALLLLGGCIALAWISRGIVA